MWLVLMLPFSKEHNFFRRQVPRCMLMSLLRFLWFLCPFLLLLILRSFVSALSSVFGPSSHTRALASPGWKGAMDEEMIALSNNGTWELTNLPPGKQVVGCRWVYVVKYHPDGTIED